MHVVKAERIRDHAYLHEARPTNTGVAHERNEPTGSGNNLVDDFPGPAFTAEEEVGVLFVQRDEAAIGLDGAPGFRRLCHLACLKHRHDLRQRTGRDRLRALDPVQLCETPQTWPIAPQRKKFGDAPALMLSCFD